MDTNTTIGPLINIAQFQKVSAMVEDAKQKGAKVLLGGKPHSLGRTYYEPTLLVDIDKSMLCYQQEIFGPVAMTMK
jgi:acyl-CoA reductase-like NAD-dependent aldehyde dehydrogenase